MVIVPPTIDAPTATDPLAWLFPRVIVLAPEPPIAIVSAEDPVPILIVFVLLSEPIEIVFPLPVIARFPLGTAIVIAPLPDALPIVVAALPVTLIWVVPTTVNAAKVVPPVGVIVPDTVKLPVIAVLPVESPIATAPVPPVPIVVTPAPVALRPRTRLNKLLKRPPLGRSFLLFYYFTGSASLAFKALTARLIFTETLLALVSKITAISLGSRSSIYLKRKISI